MANVNSISNNSYSSSNSLYGNRNVLTGLASGMDTETMIQNSIVGYQTKITQLEQSQTKVEWKQEAYRGLIDQMYNITQKYTSFTSNTNLASNSFFTGNVNTVTKGGNADAISATGKATSDIQINAVKQLATAARYTVDADKMGVAATSSPTGDKIDWSLSETMGQVKGTMSLKYGTQNIDLNFTDKDTFGFSDTDTEEEKAEKLRKTIENKLGEIDITVKSGTVKARALIDVRLETTRDESGNATGFKYVFEENATHPDKSGNSVYINSVSGNIKATLGADKPSSTETQERIKNNSFSLGNVSALVAKPNLATHISGKTVDVTLDGSTKQFKIGDLTGTKITVDGAEKTLDEAYTMLNAEGVSTEDQAKIEDAIASAMNTALKNDLQNSIDKQFGKGKITVSIKDGALDFSLSASANSQLKVSSEVGEKLGIGTGGVSNYFNTANTLKRLLGEDWLNENARIKASDNEHLEKVVTATEEWYRDAEGHRVDAEGYLVDDNGKYIYGLEINGAKITGLTADSTIESVINKISSSSEAGVKVGYSTLTGQFVFTAAETGEGGDIVFGEGLAQKLFAVKDTPATKSLESLLGENFAWDEDGNATILLNSPNIGIGQLGKFNKNDSLETFMSALDSTAGGALKGWFTYDETTGDYKLQSTDGSDYQRDYAGTIRFSSTAQPYATTTLDTLAERAKSTASTIGFTKTAGQDAIISATVNGKELADLHRSSNVINMDGLTVTLKEEFSAYGEDGKLKAADAVTFQTSSDSDKIVEVVRSFVEDVNKLMNDVHSAYTTQPLTKSSSSRTGYDPLTEEDKADMSETAIKAYEEKAKTGLLFGDSDLSQLYNKLLGNLTASGADRIDLESIGLTTSYSSGVTTFSLNESKLRAALDSDPDKVRTVFTRTTDSGAKTNGLMASLKQTMTAFGSTSIGSPGILVRKAGTRLSAVSLMNNSLQQQIDNFTKQIESWQTKLSDRVDYYTKQFTQLEQLMSTMNNQSSMLADMMGY